MEMKLTYNAISELLLKGVYSPNRLNMHLEKLEKTKKQ